jgi:membrane protease YdiL (CAAX protease family)
VWYGPAAILVAASIMIVFLGPLLLLIRALAGVKSGASVPELTIAETVLTDLVIVGSAVAVAALSGRPRLRDFGFRATALWPAVGFAVLGMAAYLAFAGLYQVLLPQDVEQSTLENLGADRGVLALVVVGVLVVVVAPFTEEFFFRGFLYRSLRARLPVPIAAVLAGGFFGSIHYTTGIAATLPLAVLGVVFCLIVERTGSIYPVIALHAVVNATAYTLSPDAPAGSPAVALPLLAAVLAACLLLPRRSRRRERSASVDPLPAPG